MDIILKGVSLSDLKYLRDALECRIFKVRLTLDKVRSDSKMDSDANSKDYYESLVSDIDDEFKSLNGLLDML